MPSEPQLVQCEGGPLVNMISVLAGISIVIVYLLAIAVYLLLIHRPFVVPEYERPRNEPHEHCVEP